MTFLWLQGQAVVPLYSMKARAYAGSEGTAPHVLNFNNQSSLASASLPGHFSPRKEPQRRLDFLENRYSVGAVANRRTIPHLFCR